MAHSQQDTFSFSLDGYRPEKMLINADNYTRVKLKPAPARANNRLRDRLSSFTKDLGRDEQKKWFTGDESYASLLDNRFLIARQFPSTGMSLNVDRASYSNIRRFISMNSIVPPDAFSAETLGTERAGNGVLIREGGVVLTIGYLVTEAEHHANLIPWQELAARRPGPYCLHLYGKNEARPGRKLGHATRLYPLGALAGLAEEELASEM